MDKEMADRLAEDCLGALDNALDPSIWRTKYRIQELMLEQNPQLHGNIFVTNICFLYHFLIGGILNGEVLSDKHSSIGARKETMEEGTINAPFDIEDIGQNSRLCSVEFSERWIFERLLEGMGFSEITSLKKELTRDQEIDYIRQLWGCEKYFGSTIFYRKFQFSRYFDPTKLPALLAE